MSWDGVVRVRRERISSIAERHGGRIRMGGEAWIERLVPVDAAAAGDLAPVLTARALGAAARASERGATLLVAAGVSPRDPVGGGMGTAAPSQIWVHDHAVWALAQLLDEALVDDVPAVIGKDSTVAPTAILAPRVVVGERVTIGPGAVIGQPGFGWATGPSGAVRHVPQLGGVFVEDDVWIGSLCTVDSGTLAPTRVRRGVRLDAQVHVGHNADIGEGTFVAAQSGFAGSVTIGRGVLVGGQVGVADHVTVGDGARIAAKSGVIGDVPAGAVVAGYPAVARSRWLRGLASVYRGYRRRSADRRGGS